MTYSTSTIYLLINKLIEVGLMLVYLFSPLILITIIKLHAKLKNELTRAVNRVALLLIVFCMNKALLIYYGDMLFNIIQLILIILIQWHVSRFYFNMATFKRKIDFYTYGVKYLFRELTQWLQN